MRWLHSIRQDKRLISEKSEAELAYNGARISLTFRLIGTFLDKDQHKIWGQGATSKTREGAQTVINGDTAEAREMIQAFGQENHLSQFDWAAVYGRGFDVLHISNAPNLFLSGDSIADFRVKILLELYDIAWKEGKFSPSFNWNNDSSVTKAPSVPERLPVKFVDNDLNKSTVTGDLAIMLYLDSVYGPGSRTVKIPQVDLARQFTRFYQASELLQRWRAIPFSIKPFRRELALWEVFASEAAFIAGATASLADYVLFPILDDMEAEWGPGACEWENLSAYFERMKDLDCVKKAKCDIGDSKS
jgi:glutathione S-transferase